MEWTDRGVVVGVRSHGETSVILDVLTRDHGRHLGFVHGGRSRRMRPCLQIGNAVDLAWRSRLEEQLGTFVVEPRRQRAARLMESASALHAVQHLCALVRLLAEREPHGSLHDTLDELVDTLDDGAVTPAAMVRFELLMLRELGYGLGLDRCAATGVSTDLVYVSPRSGQAVSAGAGAPYHDRLLPFPGFLSRADGTPALAELMDGFRLTGFFLERDVFGSRGLELPAARAAYVRAVTVGA